MLLVHKTTDQQNKPKNNESMGESNGPKKKKEQTRMSANKFKNKFMI